MPNLPYSKLLLATAVATLVGCSSGSSSDAEPVVNCDVTPDHAECPGPNPDPALTLTTTHQVTDTDYALYIIGEVVGGWDTAKRMTLNEQNKWEFNPEDLTLVEGQAYKYILALDTMGDSFVLSTANEKSDYFWMEGDNLTVAEFENITALSFEGITCDESGCEVTPVLETTISLNFIVEHSQVLYIELDGIAYRLSQVGDEWSITHEIEEDASFKFILAKQYAGLTFTPSSVDEGKEFVYSKASYTADSTSLNYDASNVEFEDFNVVEPFNATVGLEYPLGADETAVWIKFENETDAESLTQDAGRFVAQARDFEGETTFDFYVTKSASLDLSGVDGEDFIKSTSTFLVDEEGELIIDTASFSSWKDVIPTGEYSFSVTLDWDDSFGYALFIAGGNGDDSWNTLYRMTYVESTDTWEFKGDNFKEGEGFKYILGHDELGETVTLTGTYEQPDPRQGVKFAWMTQQDNLVMAKDNSHSVARDDFGTISENPTTGGGGATTISPSFEIKVDVGEKWAVFVAGGTDADSGKADWNNANMLEYINGVWKVPSQGDITFDWFVDGAEFNIIKAPHEWGPSFQTEGASDSKGKTWTWRKGPNFTIQPSISIDEQVEWNEDVTLPGSGGSQSGLTPCQGPSMYLTYGISGQDWQNAQMDCADQNKDWYVKDVQLEAGDEFKFITQAGQAEGTEIELPDNSTWQNAMYSYVEGTSGDSLRGEAGNAAAKPAFKITENGTYTLVIDLNDQVNNQYKVKIEKQ